MRIHTGVAPWKAPGREMASRRAELKEAFRRQRLQVGDLLSRLEQRDPLMARAARDLLGDPRRVPNDSPTKTS